MFPVQKQQFSDMGFLKSNDHIMMIQHYTLFTMKWMVAVCCSLAAVTLQAQTGGHLEDADGNVYPFVVIGDQEWMSENLRTTRFGDGTPMPLVNGQSEWNGIYGPAYCWYGNDRTRYEENYGALYNWYAVNTGKLCPEGWHVPSDAEWQILARHLGGENSAGGKLKSTGMDLVAEEISEDDLDKEKPTYVPGGEGQAEAAETRPAARSRWNSPNTAATNETGFSAQPGGHRGSGSSSTTSGFNYLGNYGFWWSASESSPGVAWYRQMYYDHGKMSRMTIGKNDGQSVRCVRDR